VVTLVHGKKPADLIQKLRGIKISAKFTLEKMAWYIFAASVLYLVIVLIIAPYKVLRYSMPVFPFLVILPAMLINGIGPRAQRRVRYIAAGAALLLCGCFAFNATRESRIENIFRGKQNEYVFTQDKNAPVYVVNAAWSLWKYANLIPYVHDEQDYYFIDWYKYFDEYRDSSWQKMNIELPEVKNYAAIYLLTEYFPAFPQYDGLIDLIMEDLRETHSVIENEVEIYTGEPESWFPYFVSRKITMSGR
jgi:hypothetical protein